MEKEIHKKYMGNACKFNIAALFLKTKKDKN